MQHNTLDRRLELLIMEGNGLFPSEIVKELSEKFEVTRRTVYYGLETRASWQPAVSGMKEALLRALNRYDQLYRKASLAYMQASADRDKLAALDLMRVINKDIVEVLPGSIFLFTRFHKLIAKGLSLSRMWYPSALVKRSQLSNRFRNFGNKMPSPTGIPLFSPKDPSGQFWSAVPGIRLIRNSRLQDLDIAPDVRNQLFFAFENRQTVSLIEIDDIVTAVVGKDLSDQILSH